MMALDCTHGDFEEVFALARRCQQTLKQIVAVLRVAAGIVGPYGVHTSCACVHAGLCILVRLAVIVEIQHLIYSILNISSSASACL